MKKEVVKIINNYCVVNEDVVKDGVIVARVDDFVDSISIVDYDPDKGCVEVISHEVKELPNDDVLKGLRMTLEGWYDLALAIAKKYVQRVSFS